MLRLLRLLDRHAPYWRLPATLLIALVGVMIFALLGSGNEPSHAADPVAGNGSSGKPAASTAIEIDDLSRSKIKVSTAPRLYPDFNAKISDYVTRCPNGVVRVVVSGAAGYDVAIAGRSARAGGIRVALEPGQGFEVTIAKADHRPRRYFIRCLPNDFPDWSFTRFRPSPVEFTAVSAGMGEDPRSRYATIFDGYGVPIWWHRGATPSYDTKVLADGTISWSRSYSAPYGIDPRMGEEVHALDGRQVNLLQVVGGRGATDHHDFQLLRNGNYMLISYARRPGTVDFRPYGGPAGAEVVDGQLQELTPDGELVWQWSTDKILDLSEDAAHWEMIINNTSPHPDGSVRYDPAHLNSVDEVSRDRLLVSLRRPDAIYMIDRHTGEVIWKLGGTETPESLRVIGDPGASEGTFGSQHDARWHGRGLVTVFDNSTGLDRYPRAVLFRVNEKRGTARYIEERIDPKVSSSGCCGSANLLDNGGWVVGWGGNPYTTAYAPNGQVAWRLDLGSASSYRAVAVEPGIVSRREFRAGMDAQFPRR